MTVFWYEAPCAVAYNGVDQGTVVIVISVNKVLLNIRSVHFCVQLTEPRKEYYRSWERRRHYADLQTLWGVAYSEGTDPP